MSRSELTFKEVAGHLGYIKVVWNGKVVFDDTLFLVSDDLEEQFGFDYCNKHFGINGLNYFQEHYNNKKVYSMYVIVTQFHHCELFIEGEDDSDILDLYTEMSEPDDFTFETVS